MLRAVKADYDYFSRGFGVTRFRGILTIVQVIGKESEEAVMGRVCVYTELGVITKSAEMGYLLVRCAIRRRTLYIGRDFQGSECFRGQVT